MEACPQFTFYAGHSNLFNPFLERASPFPGPPLPTKMLCETSCSVKSTLLRLSHPAVELEYQLTSPSGPISSRRSQLPQVAELQGRGGHFQANGRGQRKVQCGFPLHVLCERSQMGFVCPLVVTRCQPSSPICREQSREGAQSKEGQS